MNPSLSISEMALRLVAAAIAGALVGMERESHGRPAGLRTTLLACVAATAAMIVSESFYLASIQTAPQQNWHPDPARLASGVLTGIGFLGAGTILRHENLIRGVTTAASLWFVTVLGLAFGSGSYVLGAMGTGLALVTLLALPMMEKHVRSDWYSTLTITLEMDALGEQQLKEDLGRLGLIVKRMQLDYDLAARRKTIACDVKLEKQSALELPTSAIAALRRYPGVLQIRWS